MIISCSPCRTENLFVYCKNNETNAFRLPFLIFRLSKELCFSFKFGTVGETIAQFEFRDCFLSYGYGNVKILSSKQGTVRKLNKVRLKIVNVFYMKV